MSTTPLSLRTLSRFVLILGAFLAAFIVARADDIPAGILSFSVDVPAGKLSLKEIHDVTLKAAIDRGWTAKQDSENKIVVYLSLRKHDATVTFLLSDAAVQVYCEGYATNRNGIRKGPQQPTGWLNYLKQDITRGLANAAVIGKK